MFYLISYNIFIFLIVSFFIDQSICALVVGYYHLGTCRVSPDHRYLAYTLDTTAEEQFTLHIKDLKHGKILPQLNVAAVVNLAWAQDGRTLFYTVSDETKRPYR